MHDDVDALVIGSGAAGLTTALCLAQAGQKVLVCEQHYVPGGWCHSFTLSGYRFSPGVHYIGNLGPGGEMRAVYEGLGVSGDLAFCEINPDGYDHVRIGEERFDFPKGRERLAERLKARFPHEARGIEAYLQALSAITMEIGLLSRVRLEPKMVLAPWRSRHALRWGFQSAQALVDHFVSDPLLKAILLAQSGDHGMPPSMASAAVHAAIAHHYFNGGFYPLGGGFAIPRAFVRGLRRAGGELRLETRVSRILLGNGRVQGVQLADGTQIRARYVISNADPEVTLGQLVGRSQLSARLRRRLNRADYSTSAVSLFMAVDMDLRAAGLDSGNYWSYRHTDLDAIYREGLTDRLLDDAPPAGLFLTVTTLKDPSKMHHRRHTLEAFAFVNYAPFQRWEAEHRSEGGPPKPADYLALKERLLHKMIAAADTVAPGLKDQVVFAELGTPLSNRYYVEATQGNLYGLSKGRFQVGPLAFPVSTEIEGLYMVGASTTGHGVAGATASGLTAARRILGCRTADLLRQQGPSLAVYPSEDISQWPEKLRQRIERGREVEEDWEETEEPMPA